MHKASTPDPSATTCESGQVFELAAEVFRVMSAPMRLKIVHCLYDGEKNVSQLLEAIGTTQPNMSQHLNTMYQAGVLDKRRDGVQVYYRIANERVVALCRAVCAQMAIDADVARQGATEALDDANGDFTRRLSEALEPEPETPAPPLI
jgi:DNA-binding transcriptional ArsR family regulator